MSSDVNDEIYDATVLPIGEEINLMAVSDENETWSAVRDFVAEAPAMPVVNRDHLMWLIQEAIRRK